MASSGDSSRQGRVAGRRNLYQEEGEAGTRRGLNWELVEKIKVLLIFI
jgi:hypothetical protein